MSPEIEGFRVVKALGAGRSGTTYLAVRSRDGREVAAKCILRGDRVDEHVVREVCIQRTLRSKRCVCLQSVMLTNTHLVLILDVCKGGDLFSLLKQAAPNPHAIRALPESHAWLILHELLLAVRHIHRRRIAHRDIKPENVLIADLDLSSVAKTPDIKLCDFGFSVYYTGRTCTGDNNGVAEREQHKIEGVEGCTSLAAVGTTAYVAPEVLDDDIPEYDPFAADMWSIGVVFYTMLVPRLPFQDPLDMGKSYKGMVERIKQGRYKRVQRGVVSKEAEMLLERVFVVDPAHRISLHEMLSTTRAQIRTLRAAAAEPREASTSSAISRGVGQGGGGGGGGGYKELQGKAEGLRISGVRNDEVVKRLSLHMQVAAHVAAASDIASVASPVHVPNQRRRQPYSTFAAAMHPSDAQRAADVNVKLAGTADQRNGHGSYGARDESRGECAESCEVPVESTADAVSEAVEGRVEADSCESISDDDEDVEDGEICATNDQSCEELMALVEKAKKRVVRKRAPLSETQGLPSMQSPIRTEAAPAAKGTAGGGGGAGDQSLMMASIMAGMFSPKARGSAT